MNLSTNYLGLSLKNPLVPSSSPLSADIDKIKVMEDQGASAVVLHSLFEEQVRQLIDRAQDRTKARIVSTNYLLLVTEEIGQDKADDLSSIYHIHEGVAGTRKRVILENARLFFEHALGLTCAYAYKFGVGTVLYEKDQTHGWV